MQRNCIKTCRLKREKKNHTITYRWKYIYSIFKQMKKDVYLLFYFKFGQKLRFYTYVTVIFKL